MTGFEPLIAAAAGSLATLVVDTLKEGGGKLFGIFGETLNEKTRQAIFNASQQYIETYNKRHGILKVLGMREPVNLDSVYTNVQLLNKGDVWRFESLDALEKTFRESGRKFQSKETSKQTGIIVANQKQYLMVLGGPGAGKSTFLRKMGLEALKGKKGKLKHCCMPVFIELKQFTDSNIDIEREIIREFEVCGFPSPKKFTDRALEQGKLLILLDGLDEVPTKNQNAVTDRIQDFVDRYNKNRFIASCRIAAYRSRFRRFSDVVIADFDDTQIENFIKNWFRSEVDTQAGTAENCWKLLQTPQNQAAKELAQTPLLLTFLCLVYDKSQGFPDNRSQLYRKALRILLEEWSAEKRVSREDIFQGLHVELEEILLSEIAYRGFQTDKLFFLQREIVEQIKTFLAGNLNAPQHLDGEAVLQAIAVQQGILVERAEDIYSFSHLTLQEYLTAEYIVDNRLFAQLVTERLTDKRWHEVFLLVAGLMRGGADELLLLMEKEVQRFINTLRLEKLLRWADRMTDGSESKVKPVGKRVVAMAMVIATANAYAYVYANAIAIAITIAYAYAITIINANAIAYTNAVTITNANANANVNAYTNAYTNTISYIRELEESKILKYLSFTILIARLEALKAQILDGNQLQEVRQTFANQLIKTILNTFYLTREMIDFSKAEAEMLTDYLYANYLIIECRKAAVRVSPQTWEEIEDRMLRLPDTG